MWMCVYRWHELKSIGSPPSGRYCHTVSVAARRTLIFGGTDAQQPFDTLVSISLDLGGQLNTLAQSLSSFSSPAMNTVSLFSLTYTFPPWQYFQHRKHA